MTTVELPAACVTCGQVVRPPVVCPPPPRMVHVQYWSTEGTEWQHDWAWSNDRLTELVAGHRRAGTPYRVCTAAAGEASDGTE